MLAALREITACQWHLPLPNAISLPYPQRGRARRVPRGESVDMHDHARLLGAPGGACHSDPNRVPTNQGGPTA